MKISGIEVDVVQVTPWAEWTFVHVDTDEGIRGLGEMSHGGKQSGALESLRQMEEALKGRDPRHIEQIVYDFTQGNPGGPQITALCAVEQALWDILGKSLGAPVHVLLGGACREEIRLYANINRISRIPEERTPEWFGRNAAAAVAAGFDAVKLAPFDGLPGGVDRAQDAAQGIACMQAVRQAIGPQVDLMVDCHSHFTVRGALELADALRDLDLFWFEQPVPEDDLDACIRVKEACGMTVAGGEQRVLRRSWWEVLERGVMDVIMPDVTVVGGIGELKKTAEMAAAKGVITSPHGPFGPVMIAAGVQAMAAHPEFLILEFGWGEADWRSELVLPFEKIERGRIRLTDAPGLGVELNPEVVAAHRVKVR
jgi:galactonate dehydratase